MQVGVLFCPQESAVLAILGKAALFMKFRENRR
jgi:hypothetical protein